jgi:hypothetical protein
VTPLVLVAIVLVVGGASGSYLRRSREGRQSARRQRRALDTLGHITNQRSADPAGLPSTTTDAAGAHQAHVRVVSAGSSPPLPAPRPLTGGWRPTRATGAAPFRRPAGPTTGYHDGATGGDGLSALDYPVEIPMDGGIRIVRAGGGTPASDPVADAGEANGAGNAMPAHPAPEVHRAPAAPVPEAPDSGAPEAEVQREVVEGDEADAAGAKGVSEGEVVQGEERQGEVEPQDDVEPFASLDLGVVELAEPPPFLWAAAPGPDEAATDEHPVAEDHGPATAAWSVHEVRADDRGPTASPPVGAFEVESVALDGAGPHVGSDPLYAADPPAGSDASAPPDAPGHADDPGAPSPGAPSPGAPSPAAPGRLSRRWSRPDAVAELRFDDLGAPAAGELPALQAGAGMVGTAESRAVWAAALATARAPHAAAQAHTSRRRARRSATPAHGVADRPHHRAYVGVGAAAAVLVIVAAALAAGLVARSPHHQTALAPVVRVPKRPAPGTPTAAPPVTVPVKLLSSSVGVSVYQLSGPSRITLRVTSGRCWVEIRATDDTGPVVFTATLVDGQTESVSGPAWVRLGAPSVVTIAVNGQTVSPPAGSGGPYNLEFQ